MIFIKLTFLDGKTFTNIIRTTNDKNPQEISQLRRVLLISCIVFGCIISAYLLALVFSTSLAQLDDKISLYKDIPSLWYVCLIAFFDNCFLNLKNL